MDGEPMIEPFPAQITNAEKYEPAMQITDQAEADAYFVRCVEHTMRLHPELTLQEAQQAERHNLGYWTGYKSHTVAERVERLFSACHPYLGPVQWRHEYNAEEIFEMGRKLGQRTRLGRSEECE